MILCNFGIFEIFKNEQKWPRHKGCCDWTMVRRNLRFIGILKRISPFHSKLKNIKTNKKKYEKKLLNLSDAYMHRITIKGYVGTMLLAYAKFWKKIPRCEVNFLFCSFSCWFQIRNQILNIYVVFFLNRHLRKNMPDFYIIN